MKQLNMRAAIAEFVHDGDSVAMGLQLEQMIPFAAGHEMIRQKRRDLTLIGPISDMLFDQLIGAGCVSQVIAAWVGNVMMGSAYNFRRAVEEGTLKVRNMTNFSVSLALQAAAMGVPFLPTRTALGSDVAKGNPYFAEIASPFERGREALAGPGEALALLGGEKLHAVRALQPNVTIVHVQRADRNGNAHCWGNYGVMIEGVRSAKRVIVVAEEIVEPEVIASDPNRTVVPGFLVSAVVECPFGAHPSPVQGYYKRDDAYFQDYHARTTTKEEFDRWLRKWVRSVEDRDAYMEVLGAARTDSLGTKRHAWAAPADFGY